jgi:hypothetical protein
MSDADEMERRRSPRGVSSSRSAHLRLRRHSHQPSNPPAPEAKHLSRRSASSHASASPWLVALHSGVLWLRADKNGAV